MVEGKSYVMLTLDEYESQKKRESDLQERNHQLQNHLMKFEQFLTKLDNDDKIIDVFNKSLEELKKIGSALFVAYEEVKEGLTIDLKK